MFGMYRPDAVTLVKSHTYGRLIMALPAYLNREKLVNKFLKYFVHYIEVTGSK